MIFQAFWPPSRIFSLLFRGILALPSSQHFFCSVYQTRRHPETSSPDIHLNRNLIIHTQTPPAQHHKHDPPNQPPYPQSSNPTRLGIRRAPRRPTPTPPINSSRRITLTRLRPRWRTARSRRVSGWRRVREEFRGWCWTCVGC